jgi:hypothetical protein
MPNITVIIRCDDQGQYSVGELDTDESTSPPAGDTPPDGMPSGQPPAGMDAGGDAGDAGDAGPEGGLSMQPAKSIEDALAMAKQILTEKEGSPADEAMDEDSFNKGYDKAASPLVMSSRASQ